MWKHIWFSVQFWSKFSTILQVIAAISGRRCVAEAPRQLGADLGRLWLARPEPRASRLRQVGWPALHAAGRGSVFARCLESFMANVGKIKEKWWKLMENQGKWWKINIWFMVSVIMNNPKTVRRTFSCWVALTGTVTSCDKLWWRCLAKHHIVMRLPMKQISTNMSIICTHKIVILLLWWKLSYTFSPKFSSKYFIHGKSTHKEKVAAHCIVDFPFVQVYQDGAPQCLSAPKVSPMEKGEARQRRWICEHRWQGVAGTMTWGWGRGGKHVGKMFAWEKCGKKKRDSSF